VRCQHSRRRSPSAEETHLAKRTKAAYALKSDFKNDYNGTPN